MDINQLVATKIREARIETGLKAEVIAQKLGISATSYSQMENAHTEITVKKLESVSLVFNKPLSFFIPNLSPYIMQVSNGEGSNIQNFNNYQNDPQVISSIEKTVEILNNLVGKAK